MSEIITLKDKFEACKGLLISDKNLKTVGVAVLRDDEKRKFVERRSDRVWGKTVYPGKGDVKYELKYWWFECGLRKGDTLESYMRRAREEMLKVERALEMLFKEKYGLKSRKELSCFQFEDWGFKEDKYGRILETGKLIVEKWAIWIPKSEIC